MLSPYRVLDLTDSRAELATMLLADLGADVIKVEPPRGSASRYAPPLVPGQPEGMGSLRFLAFNRNKRSVIMDLESEEGRAAFRELVASADFLFENAGPGVMAARGLGFDDLQAVNPRLVYVAISPFGQDGPYAGHLATDLTLAAMGGMVAVNGDADRPPVRISVPQCWYHAAVEAALAALVAHHRRLQSGEGQFVDLSVQAAVFWTTLNASIAHAIQGADIERNGMALQLGTIVWRVMFPCKDGSVVLPATGAGLGKLMGWLVADGVVPPEWETEEDWATFDRRLLTGQPLRYPLDEVLERLETFALGHTKQELLEWGIANGVFLAPSNTVEELLRFAHLEARTFWQPLPLADGRTLRAPGPWVRLSKTPITYRHGVPAPGQHTEELHRARSTVRGANGRTNTSALPFTGVRVVDLSWIAVGPTTAKYLADHGATTVRVETSNPPDRLRVAGPFKDGVFGPNRSQFYGSFNTSKLSLALNCKDPKGNEVARRLIAWADVFLESFSAGTAKDLGLDYASVRQINPGIIMASTNLMGQTGPAAPLAGYGFHAAAVAGFSELTGWPDRQPAGPFVAYTDTIAPRFLATAIMAALDHRRRTGEGQYIEQSQLESALYFLAPEILEYQISGKMPSRMGNDSLTCAPHNVYPVAGTDEWLAIAVEHDDQWRALRSAMGEPSWTMAPALETASGRLARRAELDTHISAWTRPQDGYALLHRLQAAGVPAGMVQRSSDLLRDPQLAHRGFFHPMTHPEMGEVPYEGHAFCIRGYASGPRSPAPLLGEHSIQVLQEILGLTDEELAEVATSGALV